MTKCRFLPPDTAIIGYARSKLTDGQLKEKVKPNLKGDAAEVENFLALLSYIPGSYDEDSGYEKLNKRLEELEEQHSGKPSGVSATAVSPMIKIVYLSLVDS